MAYQLGFKDEHFQKKATKNSLWETAKPRIMESRLEFKENWERENPPCPEYVYVLRNESPQWRCLVEVEEKGKQANITFFGEHKEYDQVLKKYNMVGGEELSKKKKKK
jgi:mRNA-degrading endonuclease HigB of HigAB toxin-antitoxin module